MKNLALPLLGFYLLLTAGHAQTFQVDTLEYNGDVVKFINIVILGDGYTADQQGDFMADAADISAYLLGQPPWSHYINYFNVFAIRVISSESGSKHPRTADDCSSANPQVPITDPNTYLGCSFDAYGIHRLVVPNNVSNIANVLATNFPNYDQVMIIVNTPYFGGSGGSYSVSTADTNSLDVSAHEMGHSFAYLADEYYAGDTYAGEKPNMTMQTDPALVKWVNWMGTNGIGIYQHCCGGQSALWYRPHENCKMRTLDSPYCNVCTETIIERIHSLVSPITGYDPVNLDINSPDQFLDFRLITLIKPNPNTLNIMWFLDGEAVLSDVDSIRIDQNTLSRGMHTLTATVVDTTPLIRVDNHSTIHLNTVTWNIDITLTGTQLNGRENKISFSIFPNPSGDILHIAVDTGKPLRDVSIQMVSVDGRFMQEITNEKLIDGHYTHTMDVRHLVGGRYYILFKTPDSRQTLTFVKH